MRLVITGTPGTGKSTVASIIAKKTGLSLVRVADVVRKKMHLGRTHEVDIRKLAKRLSFLKKMKNGFVVEGHLACELNLPADCIIVLRTAPRVLEKRMKARGYPEGKIEENLMAEMLDYCVQRVRKEYRREPLELDTTRLKPEASANKILAAVNGKRKRLDDVDYSKALMEYLRLRYGRR